MGVWAALRRAAGLSRLAAPPHRQTEIAALQRKVDSFLRLLAENGATHRTIADLEEKASGDYLFDQAYLTQSVQELEAAVQAMLGYLTGLTGHGHGEVEKVARSLFGAINEEMASSTAATVGEFVLPFRAIKPIHRRAVGGKNLRLAEMRHALGLPVPPGYAITACAYLHFLNYHNLEPRIKSRLARIDPTNPDDLVPVCREIQAMIREHEVPPDLQRAIEEGHRRLFRESGGRGYVALRSSALQEDGVVSFAGQYLTALNVPESGLMDGYREIVASTFCARAILYSLSRGFRLDELAMAVVCQAMVPAIAAGVMYTRDPANPGSGQMVVNATRGLGLPVVDGQALPDVYYLARDRGNIIEEKVARKQVQLRLKEGGGTEEVLVPPRQQRAPSVTEEQLRCLRNYALRLEEHYGRPQDIEWAVDQEGRVQILQSRTLRTMERRNALQWHSPETAGRKRLLKADAVACPGLASGAVWILKREAELTRFPAGAVLVAAQPSPQLVVVLDKAAAVICETGGTACHLATLAREFGVPTLLSASNATSLLHDGELVTVDTDRASVLEGGIEGIPQDRARMVETVDVEDTELFQRFQRLLARISPLHLVDPLSPDFRLENCRSVHDLTRFIHQAAMREVVLLAEKLTNAGHQAPPLEADLPMNIQLLDLGQLGWRPEGGNRHMGGWPAGDPEGSAAVFPEHVWEKRASRPPNRESRERVPCRPLRVFLDALAELPWPGPRNVSLGGFMSVMAIHSSEPHRLAEPCLAVVAGDYMNFSLRTGYHYSTVEALHPEGPTMGYVRFHFRGGGASSECRTRRGRLIHELLAWSGFSVDQRSDMISALAENLDGEGVRAKLRLLAHLTVYTKQLDVLLTDDATAQQYVDGFKKEHRL